MIFKVGDRVRCTMRHITPLVLLWLLTLTIAICPLLDNNDIDLTACSHTPSTNLGALVYPLYYTQLKTACFLLDSDKYLFNK